MTNVFFHVQEEDEIENKPTDNPGTEAYTLDESGINVGFEERANIGNNLETGCTDELNFTSVVPDNEEVKSDIRSSCYVVKDTTDSPTNETGILPEIDK